MIIMMFRCKGVAAGAFDSSFGKVSVNIGLLRKRISLIQSMTAIIFSLSHR